MLKLSVIIPVYNEENTITKVISKVKNIRLKGISKEIIVIDDLSADRTRGILEKMKDKQVKILYHKKNIGKGAAIRTGDRKSVV